MARRKKTDTGERQTAKVAFWVTPTERAKLDKRVAAAGVSAPEFIRSALLGFRLTVKNPIKEETLAELSAAGHKLNALTKHANTTGQIDPQELRDILGFLRGAFEGFLSSIPPAKESKKTRHDESDEEAKWADLVEDVEFEVERQARPSDRDLV